MRRLLPLLALAATLALAPTAGATLTFGRYTDTPQVWVAADDGSGAHRLVAGVGSIVSHDGRTVVYTTAEDRPQLRAIPVAGGPSRLLARDANYEVYGFSPDDRYVLASTGRLNRPQQLRLIEVATGASRVVARGAFSGAAFAPAGDRIAYGRAATERLFAPSDVWIAPVDGGAPRNLTRDGHSTSPVWGPTQIAFTRWARPTGKYRKIDGPKANLSLINPDGSGKRALTNNRVPYLLYGLTAIGWSADGTRLLAHFGGQDTAYAVTVDPVTGRQRVLGPKGETGLMASALSADGTTVLGRLGPIDDIGNVVTMPYEGGPATVLARKAGQPAWNR